MRIEFEHVLIAICVILAAVLIFGEMWVYHDCEKSGGKMEGTGSYSTVIAPAGNGVFVPITSEETECRK
ncbi:hypothetical protein PPK16_gp80 [Bacillus phage 049ML001]|uniref:Uncharacterized protein n=1 Tax=Bacillus phage 049ML001 TaxID=2601660 RepID=A0A5P8PI22_9CAUD|nr:hypothetical protein PPK16_gp80 [Bacillus phage 049ML001]QFR56382.1 hypothetical protein 049ML001_80 [Bacillus phage 049ML001]